MKRYNHIATFLFLTCTCLVGFAQKDEHCGTDKLIQRFLETDPQGAAKLQQTRDEIRGYMSSRSVSSDSDTVITVPVVVHVIHNGEPLDSGANISDAQIQSQINVLNLCFNKQNGDTALVPPWYQHLIASTGIKFCIAMFDDSGKATTGITRDSFLLPNPDFDDNVKPLTQWDPSKYLNIWVTSLNGSANAGGDILGYAYIPGMIPYPYDDGIVVDYHVFGAAPANPYKYLASKDTNYYNLGKTAVHEVGHWLGLYHPFYGGCAGMTPQACDTAGDFICDTPPEAEPSYGWPSETQCTCFDSTYYLCYTPDSVYIPAYDMWMTYMDYVWDQFLDMFTIDQAAEMRGVLNTVRQSIQFSTGAGSCKLAMVIDTTDTTMSIISSVSPELHLYVYPNPSSGMITLAYTVNEIGEATIMNTLGQSLFSRRLSEIGQNARMSFDLSAYSNGLYFIKVQTQHSQKTLKFTLLR